MLIKEHAGRWADKINFIDRNEHFVGYDWSTQCCESYGYHVARTPSHKEDVDAAAELLADDFVFDISQSPVDVDNPDDDEEVIVAFKCVNDAGSVLWLCLTNSHNGYYSHGWDSDFAGSGGL